MAGKEFKKQNGDTFLIAERQTDNSWIHARWVGIQNLDTIKEGGNYYLHMLREKSCNRLLNNHQELIGPWDFANDWIVTEWIPRVRALGLQYMAQVLAPGIYGKMSFHQLHQRIDDQFEIKMFDNVYEAEEWLAKVGDLSLK